MVFITTYFVLFSQIASSLGCALELLVLSKEIIQTIITKPSYVREWYDYCLLCVCVCVLQCWRCDCKGRRTFRVVFFFFFSKVFYSSKNRRELINENIGCFENWGMSAFVYSFLPFSSIFSSLSCGNDYSQVLFI